MPPNNNDSAGDDTNNMVWCGCAECGRRDASLWRVCLAELCGAALLVLLSCLPGCGPAAAHSPMHRALAAGLVVVVLVQSLDHISGAYFNPTVLLAGVLWGRVSARRALPVALAQLAGGVLGAAALHLLQPAGTASCVTLPADNLPVYKALVIEGVLGGCVALVNCGAWDARNDGLRDSWPLRIGITVAGLSLVASELTGASMNPVRSFGPALWSGDWSSHWVYWAGPLGGSLASTLLYVSAWRPRRHPRAHKPRDSA
ncbi:aquaporin-like [Anticarsia gemmatalis]|uniref:aquaporin-like n=1 Tax=Anticarsia gemmatalis TaxID=129554 RepID=UPI003F75CCDD